MNNELSNKELKEFFSKFNLEELEIISKVIFTKGNLHIKEFSAFLEVYESLKESEGIDITEILSSIKEKINNISDKELQFLSELVDEDICIEELPDGWYWGNPEDYSEFDLDAFEQSSLEDEMKEKEFVFTLGTYIDEVKSKREEEKKVLKLMK